MQQHAFVFYNLYLTSMDKPHTMNAYPQTLVWEKKPNKTEQDLNLSTKPRQLSLATSSTAPQLCRYLIHPNPEEFTDHTGDAGSRSPSSFFP